MTFTGRYLWKNFPHFSQFFLKGGRRKVFIHPARVRNLMERQKEYLLIFRLLGREVSVYLLARCVQAFMTLNLETKLKARQHSKHSKHSKHSNIQTFKTFLQKCKHQQIFDGFQGKHSFEIIMFMIIINLLKHIHSKSDKVCGFQFFNFKKSAEKVRKLRQKISWSLRV